MMKKVKGKVIRGRGIGRKQGYPTALLDVTWDGETGVFGARVRIDDPLTPAYRQAGQPSPAGRRSWLLAILIVGVEPGPSVELFILDFDEDLYGRTVEVEVGEKIRDIKRFAHEEDLRKQIEKDMSHMRQYFVTTADFSR